MSAVKMLNTVGERTSVLICVPGCVVSVCCVGFSFLDVVCNELHDCVWNVGVVVNPHIHTFLEVSFHTLK